MMENKPQLLKENITSRQWRFCWNKPAVHKIKMAEEGLLEQLLPKVFSCRMHCNQSHICFQSKKFWIHWSLFTLSGHLITRHDPCLMAQESYCICGNSMAKVSCVDNVLLPETEEQSAKASFSSLTIHMRKYEALLPIDWPWEAGQSLQAILNNQGETQEWVKSRFFVSTCRVNSYSKTMSLFCNSNKKGKTKKTFGAEVC